MIGGQIVGRGVARTAAGVPTSYVMVKPERTMPTLQTLGKESNRWRVTAGSFRRQASESRGMVNPKVAQRADFADSVLAVVGENLRMGVCCSLLAVTGEGLVLGAAQYVYLSETEAQINLIAVAPEHLAGSPGTAQIRGVGTSLVATMGQEFLGRGVERVNLKPLDDEAEIFWKKRGFGVCSGTLLCVEGRDKVQSLIGTCELSPDCPDAAVGDTCLVCGIPEVVASMASRSR